MKTKILYFKFTKKNLETHERNCKSKKNYENIFNNILNGDKLDNINEYKNNNIDNKKFPPKKNKIKCISKINDIGNQESINTNGAKRKEENKKENINKNPNENISFKPKKSLKTENNITSKEKKGLINEYDSKSITEVTKHIKIDLIHPFTNSNKNEKEILNTNYSTQENKKNIINLGSKEKDKEKKTKNKIARKNNVTKLPQVKKVKESNKTKSKIKKIKKKSKVIVNNIKKYELSQIENDYVNRDKSNVKNKKLNSLKNKDDNYTKKDNYKKKFSLIEIRKIFHNKNVKKNNQINFVNKITITNDNINYNTNENSKNNNIKKSFNYTLNNDSKSKKLILNNTNSNINININITNINDKNIQKENDFKLNKNSKKNTDNVDNNNNFNNNITTVNIINNNNNKKKANDYRSLFYNHSKKEKYSNYLNKLSSKGIEIQSININLGEETNDEYNKNKLKKNLTSTNKQNNTDVNNNFYKKKDIENEKKQAQSEYEYFRDLEDFWSNRSQTSFSCKSGFTASRKLRSLSRERDKIKMLNKCKNKNNDMERISDKLLSIVNNFHNNSSIYNLKKK